MTKVTPRQPVLGDGRLFSAAQQPTVLSEGVVEALTAATVAFTGFLALLIFAV